MNTAFEPNPKTTSVSRSIKMVGLIACVVVLVFLVVNARRWMSFDTAKWASQENRCADYKNQRADMMVDAKRRLRVGMSRDEVLKVFGAPDGGNHHEVISYCVGASGWSIDYLSWRIFFKQGRVVSEETSRL